MESSKQILEHSKEEKKRIQSSISRMDLELPKPYRVRVADEDNFGEDGLCIKKNTTFVQFFNDLISYVSFNNHLL